MPNAVCIYECIYCGERIQDLFKRYSDTVLKLTECPKCKNIADKYIEYDPVIVVIDLVLLNEQAYRHILWNTGFQGHWKLAALLLLAETYSGWTNVKNQHSSDKDYRNTELMFEGEKFFYITCLEILFGHILFFCALIGLTKLYWIIFSKGSGKKINILTFWKAFVLANFGKFLTVAEVIWDGNGNGITSLFVAVYTYLSQLQSYSVVGKTSKIVAGIILLLAFFTKLIIGQAQNISLQLYDNIF